MAIRIIENGKYNKITCDEENGGCGCIFSFDRVDVNENNKVICPQCGAAWTPVVRPAN